ncbi:AraC family transcriptional regulator [Paenibacillus sinopodophylli]|uniref:AraC family transcriptional regulator n=1 Tax=Paenibacillus sinopodophylli TaxID=1837342 RepID=UPI001FE36D31|nr:AraC family transcriptional regulator [Paenibacillus sinopodophylli]
MRMDINDHIMLWSHAHCRLADIRRIILKAGQSASPYTIPASVFLMSVRGTAEFSLGGTAYTVARVNLFHAGKGVLLNIHAGADGFEYYILYYKASLASPARPELIRLSESLRPFQMTYSFVPAVPVALLRCLSDMHNEWQKAGTLTLLRVSALFQQFIHELLNQIHTQGMREEKRDLAAQIISIIHDRYAEALTLESLSDSLNYSVPHLSSYFKSRTGLSPIDYLIKVRVDKAAALLLETDATLKEIAIGVGYQDPYYLGRLFKKHKGYSPTHFRAKHSAKRRAEDCPSPSMRSSIVSPGPLSYTVVSDNHYQHENEGDQAMFTTFKQPLAAVLLFSFMLVLSACGASSVPEATERPATEATEAPAATEQPKTKLVTTVAGEIEVPTHPQRIVAGEYLGSLIALGVTPVGTSNHHIQNPYFGDALKGVEDIGEGNGNIEKILDMQPDLIIMDDTYAEMNEQLPKIAPTVVIPFASLKTVHEEITYFGKLLGREQEAEDWLADYDRRIAEAKEKVLQVIPADSTFSVLELMDKNISAVGANYGKGGQPVYKSFGFKPPAVVGPELNDPGWASLSSETLPTYAGDYIVLTSDSHSLEDLKNDPIWNSLDAVKNDRVFLWESKRSWYWDPIAILSQTEELADWLVGL